MEPIKITEGTLDAKGLKFAILVSRFNSFVTERLLAGALDALARTGAAGEDIEIVKAPGSWELPLAAAELARQKRHDGVICLSAVIRGDTPHFEFVAGEAARGLAELQREYGIPVGFGLLTTDDLAQAEARAGGAHGTKGWDAALAALEMVDLFARLEAAEDESVDAGES